MARVLNFNPGPAALPLPALELAQRELLDFEGTGMSILEHSHRGKDYMRVHEETKDLVRRLLGVPDSHVILFVQGGARLQFDMVPMNLLRGRSADYVDTGTWSAGALTEAQAIGSARSAGSGKVDGRYVRIPRQDELDLDPDAAYLHITSNNTVMGTQWHTLPDTGEVPLVADVCSDILSRPIDVSRFGLLYAGAQKNLGPAGITIIVARRDLIEDADPSVPGMLSYKTYLETDSLQNTIPTFSMYLVRNVLRWVDAEGGAPAMEKRNAEKAALVYDAMDRHGAFYGSPIERDSRSIMNVVFHLPTTELDARFVAEASEAGMVGLKGHRIVGGIRASLYNAMPLEGAERLVAFMDRFAAKHG